MPTAAPEPPTVAVPEVGAVVAVPVAGKLTPLGCFIEPAPTTGWAHLGSGPRWELGDACVEWLATGADLLTPDGALGKYDPKVPDAQPFVIVGSALARFVPRIVAVQSIAKAPDDAAAEAAVTSIIKRGDYGGQRLDISIAQKYELDLNGDGVADRLYLASGFASDGEGHQADGGVYWADGRDTKKVVSVSTALSNATLLGVVDLDRDGQRELVLMHDTPTGRSLVLAALTPAGWVERGAASIDPDEQVGVDTRPLPLPAPTETLVLDPAMQVLGLGRDAPMAAVKAAFGEPALSTVDTLTYLDGGLVATFTDGRLSALRIEPEAADLARLRGLEPRWSTLMTLDPKTLAKAIEGTKRPNGRGWDVAPKDASVGVSLVVAPCGDETCALTIGWWKARTIGPRALFYGMSIGAAAAASVQAITPAAVATADGYTWADGALAVKLDAGKVVALRARHTPTQVITTKASPGPLGVLGGDLAKAAKLLGAPDTSDATHAVWIVPSPAVEAFRMTLTCTNGICDEALVLAPGATW